MFDERQHAELAGRRMLDRLRIAQPVELSQNRGPLLLQEHAQTGKLVRWTLKRYGHEIRLLRRSQMHGP
jgi:hypothetical protein